MSAPSFELLGIGNPIMDFIAPVDDAFLRQNVPGDIGGMVLVDDADIERLLARLGGAVAMAPGGSAANAVLGAAKLGLRTTFVGMTGTDKTGEDYRANFIAAGGDGSRFKRTNLPHGRCLSMVTADGQRTMRTHLGAAMTLSPDQISVDDFRGAKHAHIEGYLLFNPALAEKVAATARAAGCTLSLELSSFEVVNVARDWILAQLRKGVDVVFANEDEARALFRQEAGYDTYAREIAAFGGIAAVKVGKDGAWVARGAELHRIAPVRVAHVADTTGAGDAWAGGFLYGWLRGKSLAGAGALGSALGAECVQHLGAAIPETRWPHLRELAAALR
ncbi:MAG: adenosine kinase [Verrucomicrobiota bacterium]